MLLRSLTLAMAHGSPAGWIQRAVPATCCLPQRAAHHRLLVSIGFKLEHHLMCGAAGAMDGLLLEYLQAQRIPTYLTQTNVAPTDLDYRKEGFNLLVGVCWLACLLCWLAGPGSQWPGLGRQWPGLGRQCLTQ